MFSLDEAVATVLKAAYRLPARMAELDDALGSVVAEDIIAAEDQPQFTSSSVDGYAVRSADVAHLSRERERRMLVGSTILAGDSEIPTLRPDSAVRVMTGAPVPEGADAVIMREHVRETEMEIRVSIPVATGANIRSAGEELKAGSIALRNGTSLTPRSVALAASLGYDQVCVFRRPRVAIITTGDELCPVGRKLHPGKIRDANTTLVRSLLIQTGAEGAGLSRLVGDDRNSIRTAIERALEETDVVITTGGVSVGDADHVKEVFLELGVEKHFWGIDVKPGRPTFFGVRDRCLVFGLPGNPVSAGVIFYELVRPALRAMMGYNERMLPRRRSVLEDPISHPPGRMELVRGVYTEEPGSVRPLSKRGSHMLSGLAEANCLICVPKDRADLGPGEEVEIHLLPDT